MKLSIITLFVPIIQTYIEQSIIKRAVEKGLIEIEILDLRKYTTLPHGQVDDYQFGGGGGMVLMIEPVVKAIESIKTPDSWVILTTPQGTKWDQTMVKLMVDKHHNNHLIVICGHYEGFDERLLKYVDQEISIGDYVLTGGELPALVFLDSITRLIPNVINHESVVNETFENNLLDYPVYTKPVVFRGDSVPDVLLSGHHSNIKKFREQQQISKTWLKRPDLINEQVLTQDQLTYLKKLKERGGK